QAELSLLALALQLREPLGTELGPRVILVLERLLRLRLVAGGELLPLAHRGRDGQAGGRAGGDEGREADQDGAGLAPQERSDGEDRGQPGWSLFSHGIRLRRGGCW